MSTYPRDWTRDDLAALREVTVPWRDLREPAPSVAAVQRVERMAADIERSLQEETLHATA
jgi:hypothetical protein